MDNWMFWLLVFPVLAAAFLYFLGVFTIGSGLVVAGLKSARSGRKAILVVIGIGVIAAPFIAMKIQSLVAQQEADAVQEQLAALERIGLQGRLPQRFVTVGSYGKADTDFIQKRYGLRQFSDPEDVRLREAYSSYRKTSFCHKFLYKEKMAPNINIPNCRSPPESIQAALNIEEPVLFFVEGASTSYRRSNVIVGTMYEIRLVTKNEDLLVDYYEQRMLDDPAGITNPYTSGRKVDSDDKPPTQREFIEAAMQGASR